MGNKITLKKSSTPGAIPSSGDLDYGELAINIADEKLFFKNSSNVVKSISQSSGASGVQNVYIQETEPSIDIGTKALWVQTTNGKISFWLKES